MAHNVKCVICNKTFDRDKIQAVKVSARRYAHHSCKPDGELVPLVVKAEDPDLTALKEYAKKYNPEDYPKYDNYDAINVDRVADIPCDYFGVMGVPITFLDKYNPEQFDIVSFRKGEDGKDLVFTTERESSTVLSYPCSTQIPGLMNNPKDTKVNGKSTYARITIRRK